MEEINCRSAIQIIEQKGTNSVPFLVMCDDGELYIVKTMFKINPPLEDVINEILCVYFLGFFGVKVIPPSIVNIPQEVFEVFKLTGLPYDRRYDNVNFDSFIFFGSLFHPSTTEAELYNTQLNNKHDYNRYSNPKDFLKIGVFDYWVGNMDRRGSNPNILINAADDGKFEFLPIDHTQAFGYQNNYKALKMALMNNPHPKTILKTPMSKSILKFAGSNFIANFHEEISESLDNVLENMDFVFAQVPSSLGLSKKGKAKIKEILSDKARNESVSKLYLNYLK